MLAPECRLCGARHWTNAPHVFPAEGPRPAPESRRESRRESRPAPRESPRPAAVTRKRPLTPAERRARWRKANPEKHAAQQARYRKRKV
jgi:hypothetical protein